jgi:2-hydroxychromene-2-carboxylate isomerase
MVTTEPVLPVLAFDLGSPYAYLALQRAPAVLGVVPELEPVLLGAMFTWRGSGSWSAGDQRLARMDEVSQRARVYELPPLVWPPGWPGHGLAAMRAATWAVSEGRGMAFAQAVFFAEFASGADIADLEVLGGCATAAGLDATTMHTAIRSSGIKLALRRRTEQAWAAGVRGVPSVRIGSSVFYGDDRLEAAAAHLRSG